MTWGLVVFLAGTGTMLFELIAPRMLQPFFGASAFVWTNVIGVILLALALGYEAGGRMAGKEGRRSRIAISLGAAGGIAFAMIKLLPLFSLWLLPSPEALAAAVSPRSSLEFGSLIVAAFLFAPPVFLLATVSPQIVRELTELGMPAGQAAGRVFMLGTLGSLVGTFLPTYVLVPVLGTRVSMLIAGLMLVGAALVAWRSGSPKTLLRIAAIAGIGLVLGAAGLGGPIRPALDGERLLTEEESAFQYLRLVEAPAVEDPSVTETILRIDEGLTEFHSLRSADRIGTMGKYYDYFALLPMLFPADRKLEILVLGSGAGTMARLMRDFWGERIEVVVNVEIDPAVVALEERFDPGGDRSRIKTIAMDGRAALRLIDQRFDLIIVDAYARQVDIPFHMATREFFELAQSKLAADGVLALNLSLRDAQDSRLARAMSATLVAAGFASPRSIWVRYWGNTMLWTRKGGDSDSIFAGEVPEELKPALDHLRRNGDAIFSDPSDGDFMILTDCRAPMEKLVRASLDRRP